MSTNSFQEVQKASSFSLMNTGKVTEGPEHFSHEDKHEKSSIKFKIDFLLVHQQWDFLFEGRPTIKIYQRAI